MKKLLAVILVLIPCVAGAFFFSPGGGSGSTSASDLSSGTLPAARIGDNSVVGPTKLFRTGGTPSATTYFRGDNTWATPAGSGTVVGPATSTENNLVLWATDNVTIKNSSISSVNPSFSTINVTGGTGISVGTSGSLAGQINFKSGTGSNTYIFDIFGSNFGSDLTWILPTAAPGGANYLLNVSTDNTMGYTDPASLGGAPADNSITTAKMFITGGTPSATTYYRGDNTWATPAGTGTVTEVTGDTMIGVATGTSTPALSLTDNSITGAKLIANVTFNTTGYLSFGADPAESGALRLSNNTAVAWEKSTPDTDVFLALDASDIFQVGQNAANITLGGPTKVTTAVTPTSAGAGTLGTSALPWGDLYLDDGGSIFVEAEDLTLTATNTTTITVGSATGIANIGFSAINLTTTGAVTASEFVSSATDNTRGVTVPNTADPTTSNLALGKGWFNITSNMLKWRNGDNTATLEVFTSGAAHTLNFATTGTLTAGINVVAKTDNTALSGAQVYGSLIECGAGCDNVILPAKVQGMSVCVMAMDNTQKRIFPNASDAIVYEGLSAANEEAFLSTAATATAPNGEFLCLVGSAVANKWRAMGRGKTAWTEATP